MPFGLLADTEAEPGKVDLMFGRYLTPEEQGKLIIAIDRLINVPEINAACHYSEDAGNAAEEIEALLTKAEWYPQ